MLWSSELDNLVCFAKTQPHAAYSAFTHGLTLLWSYLTRTTPEIEHLLQPLEDIIRMKLIPELTDRAPPNDVERNLLVLPARLGGIAIANPVTDTESIFFSVNQDLRTPSLLSLQFTPLTCGPVK